MTGYATLIRYALWASLIAVCAGFIWWMASTIHDNIFNDGRAVERAVWIQKDNERIAEQAKELGEAMKRVAAQNQQNLNKTMEVINERDQALAKLNNDMRSMRASSSGMWITAKACPDSGTASRGQTDGTGKPSGDGQIRLPADVERRIQEIGQLAQETVIKHNACVAELRNLVNVSAGDF